jgi:hypothetical protein
VGVWFVPPMGFKSNHHTEQNKRCERREEAQPNTSPHSSSNPPPTAAALLRPDHAAGGPLLPQAPPLSSAPTTPPAASSSPGAAFSPKPREGKGREAPDRARPDPRRTTVVFSMEMEMEVRPGSRKDPSPPLPPSSRAPNPSHHGGRTTGSISGDLARTGAGMDPSLSLSLCVGACVRAASSHLTLSPSPPRSTRKSRHGFDLPREFSVWYGDPSLFPPLCFFTMDFDFRSPTMYVSCFACAAAAE